MIAEEERWGEPPSYDSLEVYAMGTYLMRKCNRCGLEEEIFEDIPIRVGNGGFLSLCDGCRKGYHTLKYDLEKRMDETLEKWLEEGGAYKKPSIAFKDEID